MTTAITTISGQDNKLAYRTNAGIYTFVLAVVFAFAVALITVSYRSVKAAIADPVDSLR